MKIFFLFTIFITTLIGLNGCNSSNRDKSTTTDKAVKEIKPDTLVKVQDPKAPSLNLRLRIIVDKNFVKANDAYLNVNSVTSRLLKASGFEIIDTNSSNYNLTMKIKINGKAIGTSYYSFEDGKTRFLYTAASINGTFLFLDSSGKEFGKRSFSGYKKPEEYVTVGLYGSQSDAPFQEAFNNSGFYKVLESEIENKFGKEALLFYWCEILQTGLSHRDDTNLIKVIAHFRDARTIKPLLNACSEGTRTQITEAISNIGSLAIDPLIAFISTNQTKENDRYIMAMSAWALGKLGDKRAIEPLTKAFESEYKYLRLWSALALFKLGDSQKIDFLITASDNLGEFDEFDCNPVAALRETGDKRAIEPLIRCLLTRKGCDDEKALEKITGKNFGDDQKKWLEWWKENKNELL